MSNGCIVFLLLLPKTRMSNPKETVMIILTGIVEGLAIVVATGAIAVGVAAMPDEWFEFEDTTK